MESSVAGAGTTAREALGFELVRSELHPDGVLFTPVGDSRDAAGGAGYAAVDYDNDDYDAGETSDARDLGTYLPIAYTAQEQQHQHQHQPHHDPEDDLLAASPRSYTPPVQPLGCAAPLVSPEVPAGPGLPALDSPSAEAEDPESHPRSHGSGDHAPVDADVAAVHHRHHHQDVLLADGPAGMNTSAQAMVVTPTEASLATPVKCLDLGGGHEGEATPVDVVRSGPAHVAGGSRRNGTRDTVALAARLLQGTCLDPATSPMAAYPPAGAPLGAVVSPTPAGVPALPAPSVLSPPQVETTAVRAAVVAGSPYYPSPSPLALAPPLNHLPPQPTRSHALREAASYAAAEAAAAATYVQMRYSPVQLSPPPAVVVPGVPGAAPTAVAEARVAVYREIMSPPPVGGHAAGASRSPSRRDRPLHAAAPIPPPPEAPALAAPAAAVPPVAAAPCDRRSYASDGGGLTSPVLTRDPPTRSRSKGQKRAPEKTASSSTAPTARCALSPVAAAARDVVGAGKAAGASRPARIKVAAGAAAARMRSPEDIARTLCPRNASLSRTVRVQEQQKEREREKVAAASSRKTRPRAVVEGGAGGGSTEARRRVVSPTRIPRPVVAASPSFTPLACLQPLEVNYIAPPQHHDACAGLRRV